MSADITRPQGDSQLTHDEDCDFGDRCVECDGCDCGLIPRTCTGPGCWSFDARDEWMDENGYNEGGSYG